MRLKRIRCKPSVETWSVPVTSFAAFRLSQAIAEANVLTLKRNQIGYRIDTQSAVDDQITRHLSKTLTAKSFKDLNPG